MAADDAAWQKRMWRQRQRRQGTDGLWSRLDDLVPDASEFPSRCERNHAPSRPHIPAPCPCSGHCVQRCLTALMGVVFLAQGWRSPGTGVTHHRRSSRVGR
ncbi:hypothetical protein T484DRAFT_3285493 [Baffinella frigidus]|nr:hypothetical protein T484DRAFT_3285493 [Cryptophyta sp. CCMP2293]